VSAFADLAALVPDEVDGDSAIHLPDEFWNARPALGHIRQAAHSRILPADGVFHSVLARVAGALPWTLRLPPIVGTACPLCFFNAPVGPSGEGKSTGNGIGGLLVPVPEYVADQLPIGSGEGIAEVLFDFVPDPDDPKKKIKRQVLHNAIVYVDEGEALTALNARNGSTTLSTYRAAWTGQAIGQTNASTDRKRIVPAGSYTFGITVALQPELAGDLLNDEAAGTPQRFAWSWAEDPSIPDLRPEWPAALGWTPPPVITGGQEMEVDPTIAAEIQTQALARRRGEERAEPGEGHAMLLRLKIAGLLANLDGRLNIATEDWHLAGIVADTSRAVRHHVQAIVAAKAREVEKAASTKNALRHVHAITAAEADTFENAIRSMVRIVRRDRDKHERNVKNGLSAAQRKVFGPALVEAVDRGLLERYEIEEPGDRKPSKMLRLGPQAGR
jgi:hypothetical protein